MYFKYLPYNIANIWYYNVLSKPWLILLVMTINTALIAAAYLFFIVYENETIYYYLCGIGMVLGVVQTIVGVLASNMVVLRLVCEKFDFWFKLCNTLLSCSAFFILKWHKVALWFLILGSTCICSVFFFYMSLDAVPIPAIIKHIGSILLCIVTTLINVWIYLTYEDVKYNPLLNVNTKYDFKETEISFKNMYISSMSNLIIFTLKPSLIDFGRCICKHKCTCYRRKDSSDIDRSDSGDSIDDNDDIDQFEFQQLENAGTVHKRAQIIWVDEKKVNDIETKNEHIVHNLVQAKSFSRLTE